MFVGDFVHGNQRAFDGISRWRGVVLDERGAKEGRRTLAGAFAVRASSQTGRDEKPGCLADDERDVRAASERGASEPVLPLALGKRRLFSNLQADVGQDEVGKPNGEVGASGSRREYVGTSVVDGARSAGDGASRR